jgi:hypothetical protein
VVPQRFIFQGWRQDILDALKARQMRLISVYGREDPRTFAFVIMDDVIADQSNVRGWNTTLNSFFTEGRHLNITVMITTQHVKGIGPMIRNNTDIAIVQPMYNVNARKTLWEMYGGFMEKKQFNALMNRYAKETPLEGDSPAEPKKSVSVLIVKAYANVPDVQQKFAQWSPLPTHELPEFRCCHPKYWDHDEMQAPDSYRKMPDVGSVLTDVVNVLDSVH